MSYEVHGLYGLFCVAFLDSSTCLRIPLTPSVLCNEANCAVYLLVMCIVSMIPTTPAFSRQVKNYSPGYMEQAPSRGQPLAKLPRRPHTCCFVSFLASFETLGKRKGASNA